MQNNFHTELLDQCKCMSEMAEGFWLASEMSNQNLPCYLREKIIISRNKQVYMLQEMINRIDVCLQEIKKCHAIV